ncbi:MAG: sulfur-carrier protein [Actinomycetota bacterium]|jgi:molybdopterin converting factor small subunit|nr:sulfur-carrier protein [Actinomycetota bacterium]
MTLLRYWAAAKQAAGVAEEEIAATTLAEALASARVARNDRFAVVLDRCSFLVDGDPVGGRDHSAVVLRPDSLIDVLPPFAGG